MIVISRLLLYIKFYFSRLLLNKKYNIKISFLSYCDANCKFEKDIYVARFCNLHSVSLGSYSYIAIGAFVNNATIGKFCSIGLDVKIGLGKHPVQMVSTSPVFYSKDNCLSKCFNSVSFEESSPVSIGNDVWVGANVVIMGGVTIGDGAVIGAGAVVTKDVEPYTIVAGVPAKVIRRRFDEDTINSLLSLKWWNSSEKELILKGKCFENIEVLKEFR